MKYIKHIILFCLLLGNSYGQATKWLGTLDGNYTYTTSGNTVWIGFGEAPVSGWNRPQQNDIQFIYYSQETNGAPLFVDGKGNYDGTPKPTVATGTSRVDLGERADGSTNEISMVFDGVDDSITVADIEMDGWTNLTVSAWIKTDTTLLNSRIISKDQLGVQGAWILYIDNSNDLRFQVHDGSAFRTAVWTDYDKTDETWHHVAGVVNGADVILYFDGEEKAKVSTMTAGIDDADNEVIVVGADSDIASPTDFWKGNIDDPCVWSNALSVAEIGSVYTNTLHPTNSTEVFITP